MENTIKELSGYGSKFYSVFYNIRSRCQSTHPHRKLYFDRGIECTWKNIAEFTMDMFASYLEHFSKFGKKDTCLDRVDLNKSFNKENCFWTTIKQHSSNRNKKKLNNTQFINLIIEYVDRYKETPSQRLIARHFNVTHMTVYNKIKQLEAEGLISRRLVNKNKVGFSLNGEKIKETC